ncbi:MAG: monovalent cation/H+ antiporter complex subunit F [Verrucomicrobiota bacterium]
MYSESFEVPHLVVVLAQIIVCLAMFLSAWRVWKGPTVMDRVAALDLFASLIMTQFILLVFSSGFISYLDVATAIAIVSFLATVAFARYLEREEAEL